MYICRILMPNDTYESNIKIVDGYLNAGSLVSPLWSHDDIYVPEKNLSYDPNGIYLTVSDEYSDDFETKRYSTSVRISKIRIIEISNDCLDGQGEYAHVNIESNRLILNNNRSNALFKIVKNISFLLSEGKVLGCMLQYIG